jgi:hypothetical protein
VEDDQPGQYGDILETLKKRHNDLLLSRLQEARLRSKVNHLEGAEKPTRLFLRKEVAQAKDKHIASLRVGDKLVIDANGLINDCSTFYSDLYTEEPVADAVIDSFVAELPFLQMEERNGCEGLLTPEECIKALRQMKDGKSLGLDGLTKEFYLKFFYLFGNDFVAMANDCIEDGVRYHSQRECHHTHMQRPGKP